MDPGILFGLLAMIAYGLDNAILQVPAKAIGSIKTVFYRGIFVSMPLFVLLFFLPVRFDLSSFLFLLGLSVIAYFALVSLFSGIKIGKVGVILAVANLSLPLTVVITRFFLGEVLSSLQLGAILLIFFGIALVTINFRDIRRSELFSRSSGIHFAFITCVLWGVYFSFLKIPVLALGSTLTSFIVEIVIMALAAIHIVIKRESFVLPTPRVTWLLVVAGILAGAGTIFYNFGLENAAASIVLALTLASPLVAAAYSAVMYQERLRVLQYIGIVISLVGLYGLTL